MSNIIRSTTGLALHLVQPYIRPGATVIDATCGNGHDTLALAKAMVQVSCRQNGSSCKRENNNPCSGRLLAFDIQPDAIESTGHLLSESGFGFMKLSGNRPLDSAQVFPARDVNDISRYCPEITLIHDSHENIELYTDAADAVVFNLGYLPGGNKEITTATGVTLAAIRKALAVLIKDGVLCITMYSGHEAGAREKKALLNLAADLDSSRFHAAYINMLNQHNSPPEILIVTKKSTT